MSHDRFRLTIVHPCVGRRAGMTKYIRTWQMEPLPAANLAALAPPGVEVRFYDDRMEPIPFDEPTDLVAISVETYTARRSYQIASEYRRRGVPVVMGGYHATLCPDEVREYCESIVIGDADSTFAELVDDYRHGRPRDTYLGNGSLACSVRPDRSIYRGKDYLGIHLVEFARGCKFKCEFCAVQSFHRATHAVHDFDRVLAQVDEVRGSGRMIFFVDDNMTCDLDAAKAFMKELIPRKIRWVSQTAIHVAHDEEALDLMRRSGCQGVLVGLESLDAATLRTMNKGFNLMRGGAAVAIANLHRAGLRTYGTFVFGYDDDTAESIRETVRFARAQSLFIAAFNHITPFPGTPLYARLAAEERLRYDAWWLDPAYRYNEVPFLPKRMAHDELAALCLEARRDFYSWGSILQRAKHPVHLRNPKMLGTFLVANALHQRDVSGRNGLPLGDETWPGTLIPRAAERPRHAATGA